VPLPDVVLFRVSADARPATLTLARDVLRFPPPDGSGPVSERASEIPSAFARKATASPLNEVAFCAKLATGPKIKTATKHIVIVEFFFAFIACSPFDKSWPDPGRDWLQRRIGRADAHLGLAGNSPGGLGAVWYCVGIRERVG